MWIVVNGHDGPRCGGYATAASVALVTVFPTVKAGVGIGNVPTIYGCAGGQWWSWKVPAVKIVDWEFVSVFWIQVRLSAKGLDLGLSL